MLPSHRPHSLLVKPLMSSELQQTLARSASVSGTSLHTGEKVMLKLQPAPVDSGIKFKRKDLEEKPTIDATIANVKTVERATTIGEGSMRVHTVRELIHIETKNGLSSSSCPTPSSVFPAPRRDRTASSLSSFHGDHARDLQARDRPCPDVRLLRRRAAAHGQEPHQGGQP
jgi:hypothetical protein